MTDTNNTPPPVEPDTHSLDVSHLRAVLFDTIAGVKSGKIPIEKAKTISELSQVIVNTARVEVDFIRATGSKGDGSQFLGRGSFDSKPALPKPEQKSLTATPVATTTPGVISTTQYRTSDQEPDTP